MMTNELFDKIMEEAEAEQVKLNDKTLEKLYAVDHVQKPDESLSTDWNGYLTAAHLYFSRRNMLCREERMEKQRDIITVRCILQGMIEELSFKTEIPVSKALH